LEIIYHYTNGKRRISASDGKNEKSFPVQATCGLGEFYDVR